MGNGALVRSRSRSMEHLCCPSTTRFLSVVEGKYKLPITNYQLPITYSRSYLRWEFERL